MSRSTTTARLSRRPPPPPPPLVALLLLLLLLLSRRSESAHALSPPRPTLLLPPARGGGSNLSPPPDPPTAPPNLRSRPGLLLPRRRRPTRLAVASSSSSSSSTSGNGGGAASLSGVSYDAVRCGLDVLYPPDEIEDRNALSRTDGYWPYVSDGVDPPDELTYGEFEFRFFAELLDRAFGHFVEEAAAPTAGGGGGGVGVGGGVGSGSNVGAGWADRVFVDLGSGAGRLVIGAAALHGWRLCRGLEILPNCHRLAVDNVGRCSVDDRNDDRRLLRVPGIGIDPPPPLSLPLSPIDLRCGSFDDPDEYIGDADCAFLFSTCMPPDTMEMAGRFVGRQCRIGTIVITTDYPLPLEGTYADGDGKAKTYRFVILEKIDGICSTVGGVSTGYIHRLIRSGA